MIFNIHHGQVRIRLNQAAYRELPPQKMLMMRNWDNGIRGDVIEYRADAKGNIDVVLPRHIETMVGLGYPIYRGSDSIVYIEDLLYPTAKLDSEYWRRINQALGREYTEVKHG